MTLRAIHEILISTPTSVVDAVTFYGYVSSTGPGTGQPSRPLLLNVTAQRAKFETFVLAALDPVACLKGELTALVSPHPYDLEPVMPLINFDSLLAHFKFVAGADVIADLDSRPDLLALSPSDFETFAKQLFEAMGMKAWKTQDVKDDGVDAVAVSEAPVFGGLCVIQAKRTRGAVGIDVVRALAGTMEDKRATKGVIITTSWVTKDGHDFAVRHGRINIMECDHLKYLCKEHLGLDVLISLPKPPPGRR